MIFDKDENSPQIMQNNTIIRQPDRNRQRGTGFTNINRILGANTGAGQRMGQNVASGITGVGEDVKNKMGEAKDRFQAGFQTAYNPIRETLGMAGNLRRTEAEKENDEAYEQRVANLSDTDFDALGKQLGTANYQGPMGINNAESLVGSARGASQLGDLASSNMGQGMLLRQFGARPGQYTSAMQGLDRALLGSSAEAQQMMRDARRNVSDLGQQAQTAVGSAQNLAERTREGVLKERAGIQSDLANEIDALDARGMEQAQKFRDEAKRISDALTAYTTGRTQNLSDEDARLLMNMEQYGIDLGDLQTFAASDYHSNYNTQIDNLIRMMGGIDADQGVAKLSDIQKKFGRNLSKAIQDDDRLQRVEQEFDSDLFSRDDNREALKAQLDAENTNAQDRYKNRIGGYMNWINERSDQLRDAYRNKSDRLFDPRESFLLKDVLGMGEDVPQELMDSSNNNVLAGVIAPPYTFPLMSFSGNFGSDYDKGILNQFKESVKGTYDFLNKHQNVDMSKIKTVQDLMNAAKGFSFKDSTKRNLQEQVLRNMLGNDRFQKLNTQGDE